jgi:predicted AAA+ superfamily ATPase
MKEIIRRSELQLSKWLFKGKALIITGARQVGKTTMLQHLFGTKEKMLWLNADETSVRERFDRPDIASLKGIIGNYKIIVIDEIQRIKNCGLILKMMVDNFKDVQVIATGSSSLDISETIFEPMTGRHLLFHLYPFSLAELYGGKSSFEVERELPFHLVYGLYPDITLKRNDADTLLANLSNQYLYKDVLVWQDIRKPDLLDRLLKLLAYQIGSEVSLNELANQLKVKSETVDRYIDLLEKSFVIHRLPSYSTNERKEVSKMTKIIFWDNGIRNAIIQKFDDFQTRDDKGALWENFMIAERMKMNAWSGSKAKGYFWRNYNQSEVDYLEKDNRSLHAFEMKWNTHKNNKVSDAFTNAYPKAKTEVITPMNFMDFCGVV